MNELQSGVIVWHSAGRGMFILPFMSSSAVLPSSRMRTFSGVSERSSNASTFMIAEYLSLGTTSLAYLPLLVSSVSQRS